MKIVFTVATAHSASTAVGAWITRLVAVVSLVARMAQTKPSGGVTSAVSDVAVTAAVAAGPPPAVLALTHTSALITGRHVAVTGQSALQAPEALVALAATRDLLTAGAH